MWNDKINVEKVDNLYIVRPAKFPEAQVLTFGLDCAVEEAVKLSDKLGLVVTVSDARIVNGVTLPRKHISTHF